MGDTGQAAKLQSCKAGKTLRSLEASTRKLQRPAPCAAVVPMDGINADPARPVRYLVWFDLSSALSAAARDGSELPFDGSFPASCVWWGPLPMLIEAESQQSDFSDLRNGATLVSFPLESLGCVAPRCQPCLPRFHHTHRIDGPSIDGPKLDGFIRGLFCTSSVLVRSSDLS